MRTPRIVSPVRCEEPGEGRDKVDTVRAVDAIDQPVPIPANCRRRLYNLQLVPQPLHTRPSDRDRALEAVRHGHIGAKLEPHRREQAILGVRRRALPVLLATIGIRAAG